MSAYSLEISNIQLEALGIESEVSTLSFLLSTKLLSSNTDNKKTPMDGYKNNKEICKICYIEESSFNLRTCGHEACKSCLVRMLTMYAKPDIDVKFPITCPIDKKCGKAVSIQDMLLLVNEETFEKICLQATKKYVESSGKYKFCITSGCDGVIPFDSEPTNRGKVTCQSCKTDICTACVSNDGLKHLVKWHNESTCAQFQSLHKNGGETLLNETLKRIGGRRCENCGHYVERNNGCDHMTCLCKHAFCYLCGNPSTSSSCRNPCPR